MRFNLTKTLVALVSLLCTIGVYAHDFEVGGIYYNLLPENDEVSVTYYGNRYWDVPLEHKYKGDITIPEKVLYQGTSYCVTAIGMRAFYACYSLTEITIPNSVTTIGEDAFENCSSLTEITIPNSVNEIGYDAFRDCSSLTEITIPNSVTWIGGGPFSGCSSLTEIVVESGNRVYDSRENCNAIIETATNTIISGCCNTIIPNSVTTIGEDAFLGCSSLTEITIPNSVTKIGYSAFTDCI